MPTYLGALPDELFKKIYRYLKDDVIEQVEVGNGFPVYPIAYYYCFTRANSDCIRHHYMRNKLKERGLEESIGMEADWYRFAIDLERPTMFVRPHDPWNVLPLRRWTKIYTDGTMRGGIRWYTSFESNILSPAGWRRLLAVP